MDADNAYVIARLKDAVRKIDLAIVEILSASMAAPRGYEAMVTQLQKVRGETKAEIRRLEGEG